MREFIGGALALLSFAAFAISIVAIFKPLPKLKLPTRGRAVLAAIGSFIAMGLASSILPPQPDAAAPATSSTPAKAVAASEPAPDLKAETREVWAQITEQVEGCDRASKQVAAAFDKSRDPYALYGVVTSAQARCKDSWLGFSKVKPPPSARGAIKTGFKEAIETCGAAYFMKFDAYEKMAKVLDGDSRPSAVTTAKSSMEEATGAQMACVGGFLSASEKAGVSMDDLTNKAGKAP